MVIDMDSEEATQTYAGEDLLDLSGEEEDFKCGSCEKMGNEHSEDGKQQWLECESCRVASNCILIIFQVNRYS